MQNFIVYIVNLYTTDLICQRKGAKVQLEHFILLVPSHLVQISGIHKLKRKAKKTKTKQSKNSKTSHLFQLTKSLQLWLLRQILQANTHDTVRQPGYNFYSGINMITLFKQIRSQYVSAKLNHIKIRFDLNYCLCRTIMNILWIGTLRLEMVSPSYLVYIKILGINYNKKSTVIPQQSAPLQSFGFT